jgi:hypothetical protein
MLLDSTAGLQAFQREFQRFIESPSTHVSFAAVTSADPAPYSELLGGLRIEKAHTPPCLRISEDRWLHLAASPEELTRLCGAFRDIADGDHRHWYLKPVSLIIEADEWRAGGAS